MSHVDHRALAERAHMELRGAGRRAARRLRADRQYHATMALLDALDRQTRTAGPVTVEVKAKPGVDPEAVRVVVQEEMREAARVGSRRVPGLSGMR